MAFWYACEFSIHSYSHRTTCHMIASTEVSMHMYCTILKTNHFMYNTRPQGGFSFRLEVRIWLLTNVCELIFIVTYTHNATIYTGIWFFRSMDKKGRMGGILTRCLIYPSLENICFQTSQVHIYIKSNNLISVWTTPKYCHYNDLPFLMVSRKHPN